MSAADDHLLPPWNDLPPDLRAAVIEKADDYGCYCGAADCAHDIYNLLRERLTRPIPVFPLFEREVS